MSKKKRKAVKARKDEASENHSLQPPMIKGTEPTIDLVYDDAAKKGPLYELPSLPKLQPSARANPEPTTAELALIAATLRRGEGSKWSELASSALDLWEACGTEVWERRERRRCAFDELCANLIQPEKFPITLAGFLELMLPKRRPDDREKVYRDFLRDWKCLEWHEVGDLLGKHKTEPIGLLDFMQRALLFQAWMKVDYTTKKQLAGIKGAGKRKEIEAEERAARELRKQAIVSENERWYAALYAKARTMGF